MSKGPGTLTGRVALVTGAARGIGRGIALVLGEAGATVYVTDQESRNRKLSDLPGTVEDTAEQLTERGGEGIGLVVDHAEGIGLVVDHADDAEVQAAFDRVRTDHGGLDLLVANVTAGNDLPFRAAPVWELAMQNWHDMFDCGIRAHIAAARLAAPLLIGRERPLVVLTGYTDPEAEVIGGNLFYDLAMTATSRLAHSLAHDLRPHGATALAVSPGFTRTEAIVAALGDSVPGADSVELPGRAVRAHGHRPRRLPAHRPDAHRRPAGRRVRLHRHRLNSACAAEAIRRPLSTLGRSVCVSQAGSASRASAMRSRAARRAGIEVRRAMATAVAGTRATSATVAGRTRHRG
jgi:NAD(P)-dependent dehydrogenase (short-subunit alcohol dehydrogenase family)